MLRQPALSAIYAYQRYLSPHKGYGCAYRLAHGGTGCSGYAKHTITDLGVLKAIPLILKRFAQCKQAALTLHADKSDKNDNGETQRDRKTRWYDYCDPCGGCYCPRGSSSAADASPDCTPDCTPDCCSL